MLVMVVTIVENWIVRSNQRVTDSLNFPQKHNSINKVES